MRNIRWGRGLHVQYCKLPFISLPPLKSSSVIGPSTCKQNNKTDVRFALDELVSFSKTDVLVQLGTVKPSVFTRPLLSGHLPKSSKWFPLIIVHPTYINWSPPSNGCGYLLWGPNAVFLILLTSVKWSLWQDVPYLCSRCVGIVF